MLKFSHTPLSFSSPKLKFQAPFLNKFKTRKHYLLRHINTIITKNNKDNLENNSIENVEIPDEKTTSITVLENHGGKMVVELVAAWDKLSDKLSFISSKSSEILLKALKVAFPILQRLPPGDDGRSHLSRAISVSCVLADLQVDAEVIVVGLLKEAYEIGAIGRHEINVLFGKKISHLLHDCLRVKRMPRRLDVLDDTNANALRKYCLAYHDIRAVIVQLASQLDLIKYSKKLPKYQEQTFALDILQIYAPLAHAIGTSQLSQELEDLAFKSLFPNSYSSVDAWLASHESMGKAILNKYKDQILKALQDDYELSNIVDNISIKVRYKSRFSTMRKLLRDARKPDEVYDVLGIRIVLNPTPGNDEEQKGTKSCYRTYEIITGIYEEVPKRMKDYIANPKPNGYQSLHLAVRIDHEYIKCPLIEIQIRTTEMDAIAVGGAASHSLYKGEVTDPEQARQLKEIMMAAADLAAFHFHDASKNRKSPLYNDTQKQMFKLFDKNEDGFISMEELKEMMEELGANKDDAHELMHLVDVNSDGFLSADEFAEFQKRVKFLHNVNGMDKQCRKQLQAELQKY